jgi:hypothetical protein
VNTGGLDGYIEFAVTGLNPIEFIVDDLEDLLSWNFFYVGYQYNSIETTLFVYAEYGVTIRKSHNQ